MSALCGADKRSGGTCGRSAGWGTGHPGIGSCKFHGGSTPNHEKAAALELARRQAVVMGEPSDIDPHEAILKCIRIANGEVIYASEQIALLDPSEAVGPVVTTRPLKEEKGAESRYQRVEEHGAPGVHIWIEVRRRAMRDLVDFSKAAIAMGIAERQVRIAEQQAQMLAAAVRGILTDLGVADRPDVPAVVRRHLTLLAGGVAA